MGGGINQGGKGGELKRALFGKTKAGQVYLKDAVSFCYYASVVGVSGLLKRNPSSSALNGPTNAHVESSHFYLSRVAGPFSIRLVSIEALCNL